ncbi:MAG: PilZ domain-containing protein [Candidatus Omnitrophota bacterium]|jgi:c-di-GMP-binding flagellar brake protein YcgR
MKNQRKSFRLKEPLAVVRCSVKYLLERNALSQDISENGICILTPYKMDIGETVELGIYVPESKTPILATGEVVRRNETNNPEFPFIVGIKFAKISPKSKNQIFNHIRFYLLQK